MVIEGYAIFRTFFHDVVRNSQSCAGSVLTWTGHCEMCVLFIAGL